MAVTYEKIATTTLGSGTTSVTFSSIPGTYTDLVLVSSGKMSSGAADVYLKFNGSGSNYSYTVLWANSSTYGSNRGTNEGQLNQDYFGVPTANYGNITITNVMNYANTSVYKTTLSRANNADNNQGVDAIVGLWRDTSAITSIEFKTGTNMAAGFTFTIYGIKAA